MGVKGLWQHLQPAGRKILMESLSGKTLAIDVSIWIIEFMHALDNSNAANDFVVLDGFLKRICKLMYFGIKPVFVFDGATPSIKKKTLMIRRKLRHKQQVNYGKAAEKLLHNIVKETLIKYIQSKKRGSDEQSVEQRNSGSKLQEEEESDEEEQDNQSNPLLTKLLIDKHRSLLEQNEIDIDIFQSMDIEEQYEVIEELQRMHRDVVRERIAAVQSDLVEFSQMQMSTFIDGIKEKRRQKDIMIKASEAELRATHGEQQQLNGNNLRLIYMNKQDSNLQQYLPKTVLDIIDKAKKRRGNGIFRGKGKNDIEALIARNALEQQDQALIDDVFNKNPITFIKNQTNVNNVSYGLEVSQAEIEAYKEEQNKGLDDFLESIFGDIEDNVRIPESSIDDRPVVTVVFSPRKIEVIENQQQVMEVNIKGMEQVSKSSSSGSSSGSQMSQQSLKDSAQLEENLQSEISDQLSSLDKSSIPQSHQAKPFQIQSDQVSNNSQSEIATNSKKRKAEDTPDDFHKRVIISQLQETVIQQDSKDEQVFKVPEIPTNNSELILTEKTQMADEEYKVTLIDFQDFDNEERKENASKSDHPFAKMTDIDLERLKGEILQENIGLIEQLEKSSKAGFSFFTQESVDDLKSLLRLCGIPFVQAPFEAESQCAFLEISGLVDGVVTEDSDVLLFGARKVYRNIFQHNRFIEKYDMRIIESEMGLDRDDLIKLALFMGSDYTMGVRGIAAVNATEIINAFPGEDGLVRFKRWVDIRQQIIEQQEGENQSKMKKSQKEKMLELLEQALEDEQKERQDTVIEKEYKEKHKNWRRHWEFPNDFPSLDVIMAYKEPSIDPSKDPFSWSQPDFKQLTTFALTNLNWTQRDLDQYFIQVEKRMKEHSDKKKGTLEQYFQKEERFAIVKSQRVAQAVNDLRNKKNKKIRK
ncbi:hypothetical protein FGO68_gene12660 [Halteria grandinella]|uniref:DNA repair protein n=1 Tax=Halteria grandinella TaxID=5974 RepID=A0A8J8NY80_HALGN|nr:hypothetical protein FGO68_gene12660 [Halteria grandinella]